MERHEQRSKRLAALFELIGQEGFDALNEISYSELIRPLIWRDWLGNGGKLGYGGLASRYGISYSKARTIVRQASSYSDKKEKTCQGMTDGDIKNKVFTV